VKALRSAVPLLLLVGFALAADAAEVAIPPAPSAWVTDTAGFLTPQTVDALDARLSAYQATTGHQILVYVAPTTGDTPTEEWTERAFARWKVGRKAIDDGLVMFVFPTDRKVRIEVGYGLEQTVPDAIASRIIRNTIAPKIRAGQPDQAVAAGVDELLATIGGEAPQQAVATPVNTYDSEPEADQEPVAILIGIVIALLVVVGVFWLVAKLPRPRDVYVASDDPPGWGLAKGVFSVGSGLLLGGGLSGGGSGGGFMGGGGAGGGGGATGSW